MTHTKVRKMLFADAISSIVHNIMVNKHRHILIVDRAPMFETSNVDALKTQCLTTGYNVIVCDSTDDTIEHCKTKSIVAMMMMTKEIIVYVVEGQVKPFSKDFKLPSNRILITVLHTHLKKIPYTKKMFDCIVNVNDDSFENVHVKMSRQMILDNALDHDMENIHDLHMIVLILYQNLTKLTKLDMKPILLKLIQSECIDDDTGMSSIIQINTMLQAFGGQAPKKMEFTQHFSNYSLLSANKRKIIDQLNNPVV